MNREIKFRAWGTKNSKMIDLKSITPLAVFEQVLKEGDGLFIPFRNDIILMQFTGLKDKNGKEIYEGDIIADENRDSEDNIYVCEYMVDDAAFVFCSPLDGAIIEENRFVEDLIVIGNVFENPELL